MSVRHGNTHALVRVGADIIRHARAFRSEQQCVRRFEAGVGKKRVAMRGQQHDSAAIPGTRLEKGIGGGVPDNIRLCLIIHGRPAQLPVRCRKSAGHDDVERHSETGCQPDDRPDIARNVRLKEGDTHDRSHKRPEWLCHPVFKLRLAKRGIGRYQARTREGKSVRP